MTWLSFLTGLIVGSTSATVVLCAIVAHSRAEQPTVDSCPHGYTGHWSDDCPVCRH